jgi:hypothetical protein
MQALSACIFFLLSLNLLITGVVVRDKDRVSIIETGSQN